LNVTRIFFSRHRLWLVLVIGWSSNCLGAEVAATAELISRDYLVQNWQLDEGLPRNSITSLAQDKQGYLWLGTPNGLIRFDGARFVAFEGAAAPALGQGWVQKIFCDQSGVLWIATRRAGLLRYQAGIFSSAAQTLPTMSGVDSLAQDGRGIVWMTDGNGVLKNLATNSFMPTARLGQVATGPMLFKLATDAAGELWFCKQNTYGRLVKGQPTNVVALTDRVITLTPSRAGGMWISTGVDLRRQLAGTDAAAELVLTLPFGIYGVSALLEDRSGTLWIGTSGKGLFRFRDGKLEKIEGVDHTIWEMLEDAEGNLWVATDGAGLFKLRPRVFEIVGKKEGLSKDNVVSVSGDWLAPGGGGLGKLNSAGEVEMSAAFSSRGVSAVLDDGARGLWLGMSGGRLLHRQEAGQGAEELVLTKMGLQLRVLHRDQKNNLWIGAYPHGLFFLPAGETHPWRDLSWQGFTNVSVTAIAEDGQGSIWVGTSAGELHQFQDRTFRKFGVAEGLPGFSIGALVADGDDALWVGTLGGGLGRWQRGQAKFLGAEAGLIDNVITQLIKDGQGWLWIGSSRGLARARNLELQAVLGGRKAEANMIHFGRADGLANLQCTAEHQPSVWRTAAGQLRFATSKGLVCVSPADILLNQIPPPLALEEILVDGLPVTNRAAIKLPHDYKKIEFRYAAMSFVAPENVLFKRRLVGFDEGWVDDGTQRSATYPRLPPGPYKFLFNACNNDGVWNETPLALAFEVAPALWQTLWFRATMLILFTGLVAGVVRYAAAVKLRRKLQRLEQAHLLERERTRISRDLHDDLGARLTQMAFLTDLAADESGAPAAMQTQLKDVSRQARSAVQSLDETVWLVNPQKDTLPHLIAYLATYAEQFFQTTRIHCRQEICRDAPERPLPGALRRDIFLLVKEALNNVLKHSAAKEVWLRIAVRGPLLRIVIQDDGRGFDLAHTKNHRQGLENMQRRAAAAGIKFRLHAAVGKGTRVTLRGRLPAPKKNQPTGFLGAFGG
jgi:signal transduction histidine kinase/ligand-binding sensor domain-containing protein